MVRHADDLTAVPLPGRRQLLLGLLAVGLVPGAAGGVQGARPVLIGAVTESWGPTPAIVGLRDGLVELGYRENDDFVIGVRFTQGNAAELGVAARQLVDRGATILVTGGGGANEARAARAATDRIPIVFMSGSDPVATGLVQSLARPGGNVTGIADHDVELTPKRLEIFRELVPGLRRVLFPYDATLPDAATQLAEHRVAAQQLGVTLVERPVRTQDEARAGVAGVRRGEVDGMLTPRYLSLNIPGFMLEAATRQRIPAMFHDAFWVEQGGLASYSASLYQVGRQAARLVDRIIKGTRPASIPVEHAGTFELVVNLKTARALNLTIPPPLVPRIDRVIQ